MQNFFLTQPKLNANLKFDEQFVKDLNNFYYLESKKSSFFWLCFPGYKFIYDTSKNAITFQLDTKEFDSLRYWFLFLADFEIYKNNKSIIKIKLNFPHRLLGFGIYISTIAFIIQQNLYYWSNQAFFDLQSLFFFIIGVVSVIQAFCFKINVSRKVKFISFINSVYYELNNSEK
jgi:hypothetical protein